MEPLTKDDLEYLDRIGAWTHVGLKGKILNNQEDSNHLDNLIHHHDEKDFDSLFLSIEYWKDHAEELQKAPTYRQFWIDYPKYAKIVDRLKKEKASNLRFLQHAKKDADHIAIGWATIIDDIFQKILEGE